MTRPTRWRSRPARRCPRILKSPKLWASSVYRQGNYSRAVSLLQESAGKRSEDAELMYYLGMAQYRLKNRAESKTYLQKALDLNVSGAEAAEAKRVLAELK